jgi:hypothetical protein
MALEPGPKPRFWPPGKIFGPKRARKSKTKVFFKGVFRPLPRPSFAAEAPFFAAP